MYWLKSVCIFSHWDWVYDWIIWVNRLVEWLLYVIVQILKVKKNTAWMGFISIVLCVLLYILTENQLMLISDSTVCLSPSNRLYIFKTPFVSVYL